MGDEMVKVSSGKTSPVEGVRSWFMIESGTYLRTIVYVTAIMVAFVFLILALLTYFGVVEGIGTPADFITFAILGAMGIYGGYSIVRSSVVKKIDNEFPDFVRDLAESKRAGITFTKAILLASRGNYGALTPEIKKMARQISWGQSVNDALQAFASRVDTPLIKRIVSLIVEASKAGGSTADVLEAAAKDAREIKFLQSERKANMRSYVLIVYLANFSFLVIVLILCKQFLPNIAEGSKTLPGLGGGMSLMLMDIKPIFFYAAMIQSVGSGIVAGIFEAGDLEAGAKHAFILLAVSWFAFRFLVGI